jgi:hypothetical protein
LSRLVHKSFTNFVIGDVNRSEAVNKACLNVIFGPRIGTEHATGAKFDVVIGHWSHARLAKHKANIVLSEPLSKFNFSPRIAVVIGRNVNSEKSYKYYQNVVLSELIDICSVNKVYQNIVISDIQPSITMNMKMAAVVNTSIGKAHIISYKNDIVLGDIIESESAQKSKVDIVLSGPLEAKMKMSMNLVVREENDGAENSKIDVYPGES